MATNTNSSRAIGKTTLMLTQTAVLAAIMAVLNFSGLGLIKFGLFSLTTLTIPVIIGAMTSGKLTSTVLGGLFGVLILADAQPFLAVNVPLTIFFLVILRGFGWGFLCGLIFDLLKKIDKTKIVSFGATGLICAFLNTALFVVGTLIIFGSFPGILELFGAENRTMLLSGLLAMVGTQAIIEFFICAAITVAVAKPVTVYLSKR